VAMTSQEIKANLATVIDYSIADLVISSYVHMQQRYLVGDWVPAELNGGQFCEAVARAVYQLDTGTIERGLLPGAISERLLDKGKQLQSHALDYKDRDHFCRVLSTTYKFRSDRGVAHISSTYTANLLDATLIGAAVKWMFAELLRLAWKKDRNELASIIETIVQVEHPLIHELDGQPLVLTDQLSVPEEVLVLLRHSSSKRLTRDELKQWIHASPSAISTAISRLCDSKQTRIGERGEIAITPLGEKRVRENIVPKLGY